MDWRRAEAIFHEIAGAPPEKRGALLTERCAGDAVLRQLVERLLAHDDSGMGSFLSPLGAADGPQDELPPPSRIGHYDILAKIGEGGMGTVYEARDTKLGRRIALKVLPSEVAGDRDRLIRFEREARAVAALNHPNIVTLHSVEDVDGLHFLTMEFVQGERLSEVIPPDGLSIERFLELSIPITDAIVYAHGRGIVHRDLKPGNVVLDSEGRPKVLDFSLAKFIHRQESERPSDADSITAAGSVFGTVSYMAPEQLQARAVDHRADLFSLGALMFEMVTGRRPYIGESIAEIASSILRDETPRVADTRPDAPVAVDRILERCLKKDPNDRIQSAREVLARLKDLQQQVQSGEVVLGKHTLITRMWRGTPKRVLTISAAVVLVALASYFILLSWRGGRSSGPSRGSSVASIELLEIDSANRLVVLPFANLGDSDHDYIAAGITQEVISRLAEIQGLRVISRTSSVRYVGTDKPIEQIGEELHVAYALEGTVDTEQHSDGRRSVRITSQLIDVSNDTHLWADRYAVDLIPGEIFALQANVAEMVAHAMNVTIADTELVALRQTATTDAAAYNSYLRGLFHWKQRSVAQSAIDFEEAISRDPEFARAHAGLAGAYVLFPLYGVKTLSRAEAYDRAEEAARRAIELDASLAAAEASLATTLFYGRWDFEGAEPHFRAAIALDPDYAAGRYWYGELLAASGRLEEAVDQARRAVQGDPLLGVTHHLLGVWLIASGQREEGAAELRMATELEPSFPFARVELGDYFFNNGEPEDAIAEWEQAGIPIALTRLVVEAAADPARQGLARDALRRFESSPEAPGHFGRLGAASFYALIGDYTTAMERLEDSYGERSEEIVFLPTMAITDPGIARLAGDARFQDLMRRVGLD